jgi:hypothetical protein
MRVLRHDYPTSPSTATSKKFKHRYEPVRSGDSADYVLPPWVTNWRFPPKPDTFNALPYAANAHNSVPHASLLAILPEPIRDDTKASILTEHYRRKCCCVCVQQSCV